MLRNVQLQQSERELEQEHERMKAQIDSFYAQLKEKAREEEEKLRRLKLEQEHKQRIRERLQSAANDAWSHKDSIELPSVDGSAIKTQEEPEMDAGSMLSEEKEEIKGSLKD